MERITKRRFIALMRKKRAEKHLSKSPTATEMYKLFVDVLTEQIVKGNVVTLTGFGSFVLRPHRGHRISFSDNDQINDYLVVKFIASNVFSRRLRASSPNLINEIIACEAADVVEEADDAIKDNNE